jgi:hypothetical protein
MIDPAVKRAVKMRLDRDRKPSVRPQGFSPAERAASQTREKTRERRQGSNYYLAPEIVDTWTAIDAETGEVTGTLRRDE